MDCLCRHFSYGALTGTGSCTASNGGVISLSLGGDAFESNPTTADLYGRIVHLSPNGDISYGFLNMSSLNYDSVAMASTLSLNWQVKMPVFGILLPLSATAN